MDLTREYILWQLGAMDRSEIITIFDRHIQHLSELSDEMINLSLSASQDEHGFARLMVPFVDPKMLTKEAILPVLIDAVRKTPPPDAERLLVGMQEYVYQDRPMGLNHPVDHLYYPLHQLLRDDIPDGFAKLSDITQLFGDWLKAHAPDAPHGLPHSS